MTGYGVRFGGLDDVPDVALLWDRAEAARRGEPVLPDYPDVATLAMLEARLGADRSWVLVMHDGAGRLIGAAVALPGREDDGLGQVIPGLIHLSSFAVEPEYWGQGMGKALLEHTMRQARAQGARRLQLWTQADNLRAQLLYERRGFHRSGRTKIHEDGAHILHYERDL